MNELVKEETSILPTTEFNYNQLDSEDAEFVREQTTDIRNHHQLVCRNIIAIGCALAEVKRRLEHGQFSQWIKAEFQWSQRQARRFMAVSEHYATKADIVSVFDITALYELSADSTPDDVRDHFDAKAATGERVMAGEVKRAKTEARKGGTAKRPIKAPETNETSSTTLPHDRPDKREFTALLKPIRDLFDLAEDRGWDRDGASDYAEAIIAGLADDDRTEVARRVAYVQAVLSRVNDLIGVTGGEAVSA